MNVIKKYLKLQLSGLFNWGKNKAEVNKNRNIKYQKKLLLDNGSKQIIQKLQVLGLIFNHQKAY
ncbi:MAG: hypothetical protein Ct9H300mP5_3140 [Candidatus Pelagibacterales bacterium]|nr:MAG: hypothetical protein Ct9H300mP5_3140 [Pelagibacterales bacterium]